MSLTRHEIYTLATQLNEAIRNDEFQTIQEAGPFQWVVKFSTSKLYISLRTPFLRFHLSEKRFKTTDSPFTQQISSHLIHSIVKRVDWLNRDRILTIAFEKKKKRHYLVIEFFPKKPNMYLLDSENKVLLSLHPSKESTYTPPENPKVHEEGVLVPTIDHHTIECKYEKLEALADFTHKKKELQARLAALLKKNMKSLEKSEVELSKCLKWPQIHHEGMMLQSNLYRMKKGMSEIEVEDWEEGIPKKILLNQKHTPHEEVSRRFKQSKKLKTGIEFAENSINKAKKEIQRYENLLKLLEGMTTDEELDIFAESEGLSVMKQPSEKKVKVPYYEFLTESGLNIWVGKSARDNDLLTFRYAKGSDYWLHVNDFPGSHVILRVEKKQQPDSEAIQDAIQLAIGYSKAKDQGGADVCITQCKYVAKLGKNNPGKVQVSKHKSIYTAFDTERFKKIKLRQKTYPSTMDR